MTQPDPYAEDLEDDQAVHEDLPAPAPSSPPDGDDAEVEKK